MPADQSLVAAIPAAHDAEGKFCLRRTATRFGGMMFFARLSATSTREGTCRGPNLETECAGCVRRVRFRRRGLAGGILSSRGRRRRQPINCRCETGRRIDTGERHALRCFDFCAHQKTKRCGILRCRPGRATRGPGPIRRSPSIGCGVWVPAFARTTAELFGPTAMLGAGQQPCPAGLSASQGQARHV